MNKKMTTNPPYDPLEDLPDPVIFYDKHGNPTGQTMSKAEIREKRLELMYYEMDKPANTITEEEGRKMRENIDWEFGCPKQHSWFYRMLRDRGRKKPGETEQ